MSYILGISSGYHDSAAALIKDGVVVGACEEERFTGIKHDNVFPHKTIEWLLNENKITKDDLEAICFYENPISKLDRIERTTNRGGIFNYFNRSNIIKRNKKSYQQLHLDINLYVGKNTKVVFSEHHQSHAAYGYFTSPYNNAIIVSVDGVGEWETTSVYVGEKNYISKVDSIIYPNSLGMFYSTMTAFLGFKPNEGEYKVMGLAPYGNSSKYRNKLLKVVENDGEHFKLNMKFFTFDYKDDQMFNDKLSELLGLPNRLPEDELTQEYKDLAASVQWIYEKYFFRLLNSISKKHASKNLCLSGGCAYNGTANGKILEKTSFNNLWIPPAPSDAGSSIGAALLYFYNNYKVLRKNNTNPFLGPEYTKKDYLEVLEKFEDDIWFEYHQDKSLIKKISAEITDGNIIGWFQNKSEFGARALGNRSIFANPRDPQMKSRLNRLIKKREGFRPFAPIVKKESQIKYFNYGRTVPYMNQVVKVKDDFVNKLPAITHVDNSARIQSLSLQQNKKVYNLLTQLETYNKYPIVVNTSFNLKDQTMVLTPEDAVKTFLNCDLDLLVLGNYILHKKII